MRRWYWFVLGGVSLAVACGGSNSYPAEDYSGGSFGGTGSSGGSGKVAPPGYEPSNHASLRVCLGNNLRACGANSCCPPGFLCLSDRCEAPGLECTEDADCSASRYCERSLGHCLPRPELCKLDSVTSDPTCLEPDCAPEKSALVIIRTLHTPCNCESNPVPNLGVTVQNRGRKTVPSGVKLQFWPTQAGADVGDAGDEVVTAETLEPLLPGQSTDVYVSWSSCSWYMTILRDQDDCHYRDKITQNGAGCSSGGGSAEDGDDD